MSAAARKRSTSNLDAADEPRRVLTPAPVNTTNETTNSTSAYAYPVNSAAGGVVLNDIPSHPGDRSIHPLLRTHTDSDSPYASSYTTANNSLHPPSARPRAVTYADSLLLQQQGGYHQDAYARRSPGPPGTMSNQGPYPPPGSQRPSGGYVPPPPPPPTLQTPSGPNGMTLPPPPPRPLAGGPMQQQQPQQQSSNWLPPPPSQQTTYWNAGRQATYPPPLAHTPTTSNNREPKAYDPMAYSEYMSLPPLADNQPLTSATYIPGGESFGPGVGIPPLQPMHASGARPSIPFQHTGYYRTPDFGNPADNATLTQGRYDAAYPPQGDYTGWPTMQSHHQYQHNHINNFHQQHQHQHQQLQQQQQQQQQQQPPTHPTPPPQSQSQPPLQTSNFLPPPPTPTSRQKTLILPAKETQEHSSPASEHSRHTFGQSATDSSSNRDHSSSGDHNGTPSDQNWPRERVKLWLQAHSFSKEWQAAFEHLNVHGAQFVNIGRSAGQRNIGFMPQTVLPQVARECTANGVIWDQAKERDEARRLRRLVKDVIQTGGANINTPAINTSNSRAGRRESVQFLGSAGPGNDSGTEHSPSFSRQDTSALSSTPSTAGGAGDESPGHNMINSATSQRTTFSQRAATADSAGGSFHDPSSARPSLSALTDVAGRNSPSALSDSNNTLGAKTSFHTSPQQSPGLANARPAGSSGIGNNRYYGHLRGNSSETNIALYGSNLSPGPGRLGTSPGNDGVKPPPSESAGGTASRRNPKEGSRPPPIDSSARPSYHDGPSSAKEHKGLLHIFRRDKDKRKDDAQTSPEDEHSPASPHAARHAPHVKHANATTEPNVDDRPASRPGAHVSRESQDAITLQGRTGGKESDKKFVFVTPDGWNYRLIDVSFVETADQLRTVICYNLGVQEGPDVTIHLTSPGQMEHDEGLSDSLLLSARLRIADSVGTLKLYVLAPGSTTAPPESAGLVGPAFPASPFGKASFSGKPLDEATYARLTQSALESPSTSTIRSNESTLVPERLRNLQNLSKEGEAKIAELLNPDQQANALQQDFASLPEDDRLALLEAKADEHRKETERKQKAYLAQRQKLIAGGDGGQRRVHDFDNPRLSPYDSARPLSSGSLDQATRDSLVPMRKAPPVPEPTSTLVKANSLTKRQGFSGRISWPTRKEEPWKRQSGGSIPEEDGKRPSSRGAASTLSGTGSRSATTPNAPSGLQKSTTPGERSLATVGFDGGNTPRRSPGSLRSPFTVPKGGQAFKLPEYKGDGDKGEMADEDEDTLRASQRPKLSSKMPSSSTIKTLKSCKPQANQLIDVSPTSPRPPPGQLSRVVSRRVPGTGDKTDPSTGTSQTMFISSDDEDDSDDASDDGLFAIPLAKPVGGPSSKAQQVLGITDLSTSGVSRSPSKPDLKIKTSRSKMTFDPDPNIPKPEEVSTHPYLNEKPVPPSASSNHWSTGSPEAPAPFNRRESFASDVWANRPPAEALVEHLDEFFPNVDLDQPMDTAPPGDDGSTSTDNTNNTLSTHDSSTDLSQARSVTPLSSADETDSIMSQDTFNQSRDSFDSTAKRNIRRSGGLGRTKSIRDVVKGAYAFDKHASVLSMASIQEAEPAPVQVPMVNRISTLRASVGSDIVRRKSTKMFGAKIEQIKPARGSRLISLETIPQDNIPASNVQHVSKQIPERQPTFKWMKGQLIGKGTFGRVYLGMNTTTGELLAVKQVEVNPKAPNTDPAKIREMVKALDQEIDTMQHLDHVNIVQYLGCERKEYSISIFLEYISGGSIGSCLRKHGKFEESVVSSLTRQTLCGLAYLHREGILHRDLKADNILLDLDGTAKISDFGISKRSAAGAYSNDVTNSMQGSVFWMAPEVIRAQSQALSVSNTNGLDSSQALNQGYSAKVDIWSLGCVVLEMFAGRRPWSKEEAIGAIYKLGSLNQAPPIPEDVSTLISPGALSFMYDCFTIDPLERPQADTLLRSPFCFSNPQYNFLDTELYAKIRGAF